MSENIKKVMGPEEKLKELGIELPTPPPVDTSAWNLVLCRQVGNLVWVSGEGPEHPDGSFFGSCIVTRKRRGYFHRRCAGSGALMRNKPDGIIKITYRKLKPCKADCKASLHGKFNT